jgi:CRP-like cAMP-binding protein
MGNGETKVLTTMSIGTSFGEIALLKDCRRTAGLTCVADASLFSLTREHFNMCVKDHQDADSNAALDLELKAALTAPVFLGLSARQKDFLKGEMGVKQFAPNAPILEQGDTNEKLYIVNSGKCKLEYQRDEYGCLAKRISRQECLVTAIAECAVMCVTVPKELLINELNEVSRSLRRVGSNVSIEPDLYKY